MCEVPLYRNSTVRGFSLRVGRAAKWERAGRCEIAGLTSLSEALQGLLEIKDTHRPRVLQ